MRFWKPIQVLWAVLTLVVAIADPAHAVEMVVHRGANEHAPENTLAAAKKAIEFGAAYVEIDVRTSKDGVMYIMHDFTVDRTTDGKGFVSGLTSEEIDKLDAGSWFDAKFAGEKVPRLEPYLRWIKGKAKVYFDVKGADLAELIRMIYDVGMENDCFFWFGSDRKAREFRELDKKIPLKINVRTAADVRKAHEEFDADIVEVGLSNMSEELVSTCKELGIKVMVYHPEKDPEAFRKIVEWKADMVNLNHPDVFRAVENEVKKEAGATN